MLLVQKISCMPGEGIVEVVPGTPAAGNTVRITTPRGGTVYERCYTPPVTNESLPEFKTLSGSQFIAICAAALGFDRVDQLLAKSLAVSALIQKAEKVDRYSGNTPAAIQYLMTGDNALTQEELELIEDEWRAA